MIIEHARRGERNPTRLREIVLKELQSVPCKRAITPLATCSSCSVEPRFMRRAACMGMLATVSRNMKVVQKIASADGLTLVAERGLDCCCY
jgi:hypothetical protein